MKKIGLLSGLLLMAVVFTAAMIKKDIKSLEIGAKAPMVDVKFPGIDGNADALNDLKRENGLLVIFSCNTCPYVIGTNDAEGWEGRYTDLQKACDANNTGMVLVNSNEAKRDKGDSMDDMIKRAKEQGFSSTKYVLDKNSELADAFGANHTPHVFFFDTNMELVYKGAIDDSYSSRDAVGEQWLTNAIVANAKGEKINPNESKPMGCSIKRLN